MFDMRTCTAEAPKTDRTPQLKPTWEPKPYAATPLHCYFCPHQAATRVGVLTSDPGLPACSGCAERYRRK
jgi:hypothetical protein